jgi:hypothetical protein
VELLDCYRVIRVRASRQEWEQATRTVGSEVERYIRNRLADAHDADHLTLTFGEPPHRNGFQRSLGRSVEYYADAFERSGSPLVWQHTGRRFTPATSDDGRRHDPIGSES